MKTIRFPYRDTIAFPLKYRDSITFPFVHRGQIELPVVIKPFAEKIELEQPYEIVMYITHNKLVFGADLFLLGQLDPLTLGTIDTFPLNVQ